MYHILILEDDIELAEIVKIYLTHYGYTSNIAYNCEEAEQLIQNNTYHLALLDVLLPDGTGVRVRNKIRQFSDCPIVFISCLDYSPVFVPSIASSIGYEEYVVKPIRYEILMDRIAYILRDHEANPPLFFADSENKNIKKFKHFAIDITSHKVIRNNEEINLMATEYGLLMTLIKNPNTLLLYDSLYKSVWEQESLDDKRTVMVHISNLRKKIDPDKIGIISTVRGAGYIFCDV